MLNSIEYKNLTCAWPTLLSGIENELMTQARLPRKWFQQRRIIIVKRTVYKC